MRSEQTVTSRQHQARVTLKLAVAAVGLLAFGGLLLAKGVSSQDQEKVRAVKFDLALPNGESVKMGLCSGDVSSVTHPQTGSLLLSSVFDDADAQSVTFQLARVTNPEADVFTTELQDQLNVRLGLSQHFRNAPFGITVTDLLSVESSQCRSRREDPRIGLMCCTTCGTATVCGTCVLCGANSCCDDWWCCGP